MLPPSAIVASTPSAVWPLTSVTGSALETPSCSAWPLKNCAAPIA